MVEFAINNYEHATTKHTSFKLNGLHSQLLPKLFEATLGLRRGLGTRSSRNRSGSYSSRVDANVVTYDGDADQVDIEKEDHLNNTDEAVIDSYDDDNGIIIIASAYFSEDNETVADYQKEKSNLFAVRTRRAEQNNAESAEGFLLAREVVVRFLEDSIANAMERQKHIAERASVISLIDGDLFLLYTDNVHRDIETNGGSSILLPKYVGHFLYCVDRASFT